MDDEEEGLFGLADAVIEARKRHPLPDAVSEMTRLMDVCAQQSAEIAALSALVVEAFDVMATHEARHTRKADRQNEHYRPYHLNKAAVSAHWLDRAAPYYNASKSPSSGDGNRG